MKEAGCHVCSLPIAEGDLCHLWVMGWLGDQYQPLHRRCARAVLWRAWGEWMLLTLGSLLALGVALKVGGWAWWFLPVGLLGLFSSALTFRAYR